LLKRRDFDRVFARPQRSSDGVFTVLARRNGLDWPRIGLAISRKHAPRAVARNRIKRLVRESFRLRQTGLGGIDLVFLGRSGMNACSNAEVQASLDRHLTRLDAVCRRSC
jgi:ribonuclease P protein component